MGEFKKIPLYFALIICMLICVLFESKSDTDGIIKNQLPNEIESSDIDNAFWYCIDQKWAISANKKL